MTSPEAFEIPIGTDYRGTHGLMQFLPYFDPRKEHQAMIATYLINAPHYYPKWDQYLLMVTSLAHIDGVADPYLRFPEATHELLVVVVSPDHPQTVESILKALQAGKPTPSLVPPNIVAQFKATDDEMLKMAWLLGRSVVRGKLNPETEGHEKEVRDAWTAECEKILANLRGEEASS